LNFNRAFNPTGGAAVAASAPGQGGKGPQTAAEGPGRGGKGGSARNDGKGRWPVYDAEAYKFQREPLAGRAVQWEGGYVQGAREVTYFGLFVEDERVATVTLAQLVAMGYVWKSWGPCVGSLRYGPLERLVTCGVRVAPGQADSRAQPRDAAPGADDQARASPVAVQKS
jgi:hypothetical protein